MLFYVMLPDNFRFFSQYDFSFSSAVVEYGTFSEHMWISVDDEISGTCHQTNCLTIQLVSSIFRLKVLLGGLHISECVDTPMIMNPCRSIPFV